MIRFQLKSDTNALANKAFETDSIRDNKNIFLATGQLIACQFTKMMENHKLFTSVPINNRQQQTHHWQIIYQAHLQGVLIPINE